MNLGKQITLLLRTVTYLRWFCSSVHIEHIRISHPTFFIMPNMLIMSNPDES